MKLIYIIYLILFLMIFIIYNWHKCLYLHIYNIMQSLKQSTSIHISTLTITTMSLFLLPLLLLLTQPTSSQPLPLQSLSLHPSHKFDIHIPSQFSNTSDITVLVTSCNRLRLLALTMNSFFHFNTYVIRELIIVEDCQA